MAELNSDHNATEEDIRELLNDPAAKAAPATDATSKPATDAGEGHLDEEDHDLEDHTAKVDTELQAAENETAREAIRERRRQERKDKRDRQRAKQDSLSRQVDQLTRSNQEMANQLKSLLNQTAGAQLARLDADISEAENAVEHFKGVIEEATTKGDGRTVAQATEYMVASRERAKELKEHKTRVSQPQRTAIDPRVVSQAKKFMADNPWYGGPASKDPDSRVLTAVDNSLAAEGWDTTSDEYWKELRTRAARYLPHRMAAESSAGAGAGGTSAIIPVTKPKTPVAGANGDRSTSGSEGTYNLSAERVRAIKDAGAWDDPKRRKSMIDRYRDYDKQNANS